MRSLKPVSVTLSLQQASIHPHALNSLSALKPARLHHFSFSTSYFVLFYLSSYWVCFFISIYCCECRWEILVSVVSFVVSGCLGLLSGGSLTGWFCVLTLGYFKRTVLIRLFSDAVELLIGRFCTAASSVPLSISVSSWGTGTVQPADLLMSSPNICVFHVHKLKHKHCAVVFV